ncbi:Holliday junction resolvase RecU [Clostridium tertium]|uniref:Holliday junction resolvase RecU n=1 Tax=Clostridium tertium TaxID=1559 RepID=UPI00232D27C3|nr:Holliday junction resolvase RecU [Clostridium tertium]MBS6504411.1 Holliday junction resolvase RecU [Clostridium sp.]MDB1935112.1 Holliday junction resolvase RecU [Clostridium tertium]MDB1938433.1 Holliday junction resolvase RecU [Clostridium tertium]
MAYNFDMANKGRQFEEEVIRANRFYQNKGQALIQKISTPWNVVRRGKQIISAFPQGKSTLDFRGTVRGGLSISFDCKESEDEKGLPLKHIQEHQIEYIRSALEIGETSFILCSMKKLNKVFFISGEIVIEYWDRWKANKGKRGYNYIPVLDMKEIQYGENANLDYLKILKK